MKIIILLALTLLISCGKSSDPFVYTGSGLAFLQSDLPLTIKVPRHRYEEFKAQFDATEATFKSLSGKDLVTFIPWNDDPKYSSYSDAGELWNDHGEMWVLFKDYDDEFTDLDSGTAGLAHYSYSGGRLLHGNIFMNFTINQWSTNNFRQVLMHELGHMLGFDHTEGSDYSVMNYDYVYKITGITDTDITRLHEKYPFSLVAISFKDLEKMGAKDEAEEKDALKENLIDSYGLSEDRAVDISGYLYSYNKLKQKRSLTGPEQDRLSKKILGFSYSNGKKALESYLQGDTKDLEDLVKVAAEKNETTPEHVHSLLGEYFLN